MTMKKEKKIRVLLLCSFYSSYVTQLYTYVRQYYPQIKYSLLTKKEYVKNYNDDITLRDDEKIYGFGTRNRLELRLEIWKLPQFDIIHTLWMENFWGWNAILLKRKASYWLCSIGGSDLYRFSKVLTTFFLQKRIIKKADRFSSENEETREYFYKVYGERYRKIPHDICRFGVDILDSIDKVSKDAGYIRQVTGNFPKDKIVVLCGTNAREEHKHREIIKAIQNMNCDYRQKCFFVFPMTYPSGYEEYISQIEDMIAQVTDSYVVLRKYMNVDEMAELAVATDVMIHVQTTDQLSSAMVSHMYHGNLVIAGDWLPYESLRENGVYFHSIHSLEDLSDYLNDAISNLSFYKKKCSDNMKTIHGLSSWDVIVKDWYQLYNYTLGGEKNDYTF